MDTFGIVIVFSVLLRNFDVCISALDGRFEGKDTYFL